MLAVVLCTTPDKKSASTIAKALLQERLAACVSILKVEKSVYRWKGELVEEPEFLMVIKSAAGNSRGIMEKVARMHPYSVPEIISLKAHEVSGPYLEWVLGETKSTKEE